MDLSIIIVNWNSSDYLREAVASIRAHTSGIEYEIVVVDNASSEADLARLDEAAGDAIVIRSKKNLGFAGANNLAFRRSTGEYTLFLNPDTKPAGPAINTLMNGIRALPDAGIAGGRLLNADLSPQLTAIQNFPTMLNQLFDFEFLQLRWPQCRLWSLAALFTKPAGPVPVEAISGACMLMRAETFRRAGMFSEDYFMYGEDLDLNFKVRSTGLTNYYLDDAVIIHYGGGSSDRQKVWQAAVVMRMNANWLFLKKTRGRAYAWAYRVMMAVVAVARLAVLAVISFFGRLGRVEAPSDAAIKWKTVFVWAIGRWNPALGKS
jgi:N-acetylglucosaminyl-diphospho-decaprenol L-rhamnosyltransferase